ncbi:MAG: DUF4760 domain-containing protein [Azoarcus sp. PHD]|jgi:hypothetical protein|nr:MAG: DUF4760 domain-containing protein [Azoarcus sp. PHD]
MRKYKTAFILLLLILYVSAASALWLDLTNQWVNLSSTHWVSIAGILIAASGWVVTSFVNLHNARRQHTVNVLLQSRLSQAYQQRLRDVVKSFPVTPTITKIEMGDWNVEDKGEAIDGVKYLLNYFEFVAVGIRTDDLDEKTLRMSLRGILTTLCDMAQVYIQYQRGELAENDGYPSNQSYEHLIWLRQRWTRRPLASRMKAFYERHLS